MHPEMIRAIAAQQVSDRQAVARAGLAARLARKARRAQRHRDDAPDLFAGVQVPDYIDGTFHADAPVDQGAQVDSGSSPAAQVAAGRHRSPAGRDAA